MSLVIHSVVIHRLIKEQHKAIQPSQLRKTLLEPDNADVIKLVAGVLDVYGKRHSAAQYGVFSMGAARGKFPDAFDGYSALSSSSDEQFMALTHEAMDCLYRQAATSQAASGGYIVVADLTNNAKRYLIIVMVKEKPDLTLTAELQPEELMALDLSRIHQGLRVNLSLYAAYQAADEDERKELQYLSFVSPSATKEVAGYFVTALGCEAGTTSNKATDAVVRVGKKLLRETPGLRSCCEPYQQRVLAYLQEQLDNRKPATVIDIAHAFHASIPVTHADKADEITGAFEAMLYNEENQVPPQFSVNKTVLDRHTHIKGKTSQWNVAFERGALGRQASAEVYYDETRGSLTLKNLPDSMKEQIETTLQEREA